MSIYTYTYPFTSFPHGIIAKDTLYSEVQNSSITAALQSIDNDLVNVYFNFKASLVVGEITTLNTIVANHQGVPLTETVTVIQGSSGSIPWNVSIPTSSITYVSQQTGSYLSVSGTVHVDNPVSSVSILNFPLTQSVKVDQTITLPVSVSNLIGMTGSVGITGIPSVFITNPVTTASISNLPTTQSVLVSNSTLPVSVSNLVTVTGSVGATVVFPTLQNVSIISSSVTQSITGSIGIAGIPNVAITNPVTTASISNFPVTQSVKIDQSITLPVSLSNNPTVTIGNFPITQSVFVGNSVMPVSTSNTVTITGSIYQINQPLTQSIKIDQTIQLPVSLSNNPIITIGNFPVTQSVFVGNFPTTQSIFVGGYTGSPQPTTIISSSVTQSITGSVAILNFPITQSIFVGSSVVLPMSLSNNPTITIGNFPTTQSIFVAGYTNSPQPTAIISSSITQSITGSVAVLNFPVTQSVFIGGYTNAIQPVSISNQPTVIVNQGISSSVAWRVKDDKESTFSLLVTGSAIGNAKSMVSVQNASSDRNIVKIRSVKIINIQNAAVTGIAAEFRFLKATSHSAGTLLTPVTFDSIDSADANITWRTGATIAGSTAIPLLRYFWSSDEWVIGTLDQEAHDKGLQNLIAAYKAGPEQKPITIRPSEAFTITQITNSTVGTFDIEIIYTQEPE